MFCCFFVAHNGLTIANTSLYISVSESRTPIYSSYYLFIANIFQSLYDRG